MLHVVKGFILVRIIDVTFDIVILSTFSLSRFGDGLRAGWPEFDFRQRKRFFSSQGPEWPWGLLSHQSNG
jgi:hypothetical protein